MMHPSHIRCLMEVEDSHSRISTRLPKDCVAHVLSLTSPPDACLAAQVSRAFRSASASDAVWERFLPPDHRGILSRAMEEVTFASKKELFPRLCSPLLVDGGRKSFVLDKSTGKKCFMLSARELQIVWGSSPEYWNWTFHPESRFGEVVELLDVCWLEITGRLISEELSPKTTYVAYFIFKIRYYSYGIDGLAFDADVTVGAQTSKAIVCLQTLEQNPLNQYPQRENEVIEQFAHARSDGWMELVMGEFFNEGGLDDVNLRLLGNRGGHWKSGLIVEGFELRPKNQ